MAHSDFSWRKLFSFLGAGLLLFIAFVAVSSGASLISFGKVFNGVATILAGGATFALAAVVYVNYTRWADKNKQATHTYDR